MSKDTRDYILMIGVVVLGLPAVMLYMKFIVTLGIWLGVRL